MVRKQAARKAKDNRRPRRGQARGAVESARPRLRFGRRNLALFAAGGVSIAVGYVFLAAGSITVAPILLVAGYCVFFPMGILVRDSAEARGGGE